MVSVVSNDISWHGTAFCLLKQRSEYLDESLRLVCLVLRFSEIIRVPDVVVVLQDDVNTYGESAEASRYQLKLPP